jgi:hypothetical protein
MWHNKGRPKRKVHSLEWIYGKVRKISNQWHNATSQTPQKQEQANSPQNRREIIKIRAKPNEIETNKQKNKTCTKNQWNRKLVLWKNKQEWQKPDKPEQNEESYPNQ